MRLGVYGGLGLTQVSRSSVRMKVTATPACCHLQLHYLERLNPPRHGSPTQLTGWAGATFVREAAKRPMVTLEQIISDVYNLLTEQFVVHSLHQEERVARPKPLLKV
ncbi:hypothetical protein ILYODFUR_030753 [Ilyodon furcidens]|uniref:Uncharacterized protein n=1 Tax=Ilyodon furcidens TaxID=33524 RepID=A0ABV0SQJ0_9TELE